MRKAATAAVVGAVMSVAALAGSASADGPRALDVRVHSSLKMTVVASGLRAPRGLLAMSDARILVTEFSWTKGQGRLSRLDRNSAGVWRSTVVFSGLDRPFGLVLGPDNKAYVGVAGSVFRFDPTLDKPAREDVIGGRSSTPRLPARGLHPLTQLLFTRDRSLLVTAASGNACWRLVKRVVSLKTSQTGERNGGGSVRRLDEIEPNENIPYHRSANRL